MLTAGAIMNKAAALLNDVARSAFTYAYQLPYLNMALSELEEVFELNNIPSTNATSVVIPVNAGVTEIGFDTQASGAVLPPGLVEIQIVWERTRDTNPYTQMTKVDFLPAYMEGTLLNSFVWWTWQDQKIKVLASSGNNDLKLDYIKSLFPEIINENDPIDVINCRSFLQFRTAALAAQFVGENKERADDLNTMAFLSLERAVGISVKGGQSISTRRRPFRASYKSRGYS